MNPMLLTDFYKISHKNMYPKNTQIVYSTWIPRTSRIPDFDKVYVFGFQYFINHYLKSVFNQFFSSNIKTIVNDYSYIIKRCLNIDKPEVNHLIDLHKLGYLPLKICALPEHSIVPIRTPILTIENTLPEFFWLTNYIETLASCSLWQSCTSATIAYRYKQLFNQFADETVGSRDYVQYQGHDFSMRGLSSLESAILSGMGHLTNFSGTDSIPAIQAMEKYYNIKVGCSVPATEHSIQCAFNNNDYEYIKYIITEVHPTGLVSIVCDGYDYWNVIYKILPKLKDIILNRLGKVVIRPDSGDPVNISVESIKKLYDIFGGKINNKGYKELDPHIGLIYGDAITYDRAKKILEILKFNSFAANNIVFGLGSYTYQYNTRDTLGFALKTTHCIINNKEINIFKDPKTDDGIKKSLTGRVAVIYKDNIYKVIDKLNKNDVIYGNLLKQIF